MKRSLLLLSLGLLGTVLLVSSIAAQGRGATVVAAPARSGATFFNAPPTRGFQHSPGSVRFHSHNRFGRAPRRQRFYPYYAGYGPYFYYPDYDHDDGADEIPAPSRPAATPAGPAETPKASSSVVMELRGDQWVRLTPTGPVEVTPPAPSAASRPAVLPAFDLSPAAPPLPAAVLVFRDGHQEEATKYTIIGNAIFLKGDYYATGSWTRRIPIATLDIPATLKLNADRGTRFALPSRSSEVVLRP